MSSILPYSSCTSLFLIDSSNPSNFYWYKYQDFKWKDWNEELCRAEDCSSELMNLNASLIEYLFESGEHVDAMHQRLAKHFDHQHFAICKLEENSSKPCITELVSAPFNKVKENIRKNLKSLPHPIKNFFKRVLELSPAQRQLIVHGLCMKDPCFFDCMLEFFPEDCRITEKVPPIIKKLDLSHQPLATPSLIIPKVPVTPTPVQIDWSRFLSDVDVWSSVLKDAHLFFASEMTTKIFKDVQQSCDRKNPLRWAADRPQREPFLPILTDIVSKIFKEYVPNEGSTLELGSSVLDKNGHSILSAMVPKEAQDHWIYSDVIKPLVKTAQNHPARIANKTHYVYANATNLPQPSEKWDIRTIVSLNVFDTLTNEEIKQAAHKAFEALPAGGRIIVFTEQEPLLSPLVSPLFDKGQFVSLDIDKSNIDSSPKTILSAPKHVVDENIRKALPSMPPKLCQFFTEYLLLGNAGRCFFIQHFYNKMSEDIFECLNQFFPKEGVVKQEMHATYFNSVKDALVLGGFEIQLAKKQKDHMFMPSTGDSDEPVERIHDIGGGFHLEESSEPLPPEAHTKLTANMHVIVAVKK